MSDSVSSATTSSPPSRLTRADLLTLTKFRLSALVIVTTFFGFWLNRGEPFNGWLLAHTLIGSILAAFGAAVFNQLMEIEPDSRMQRTADRPLPARRMEPSFAFGIGWLLSAFALIHLANMVNIEASILTAMTLGVYLFIYTPMKQGSAWNTIVGAVSGALPPLIGWAGAMGPPTSEAESIRWGLLIEPGAIYLFLLLFLWQLPHFLAINWMYREEYRKGGFVMWANDDDSGGKTSRLALIFSILAAALMLLPPLTGLTNYWFLLPALTVNFVLILLAWKFCSERERPVARKLFFYTLIYLPLMLVISMVFWQ
ncbi:protoheme IX farnesyltransferase [Phragmitibacter flavus]|uniref:Protoheme IX farnesyltransferase n=1 Tax=Phragmitibacter flavus TaxID=2576071 RepID=A0A5R8KF36_9BACT|nr:heme o synthase [Phragmitibacter flavus]TLD70219.1 protoheme IX farnesyltransferase [Phragmitibacter flavus]